MLVLIHLWDHQLRGMMGCWGANDAKSEKAHTAVGSVSVARYDAHFSKHQTQFVLDVLDVVRTALAKNFRRRVSQQHHQQRTIV